MNIRLDRSFAVFAILLVFGVVLSGCEEKQIPANNTGIPNQESSGAQPKEDLEASAEDSEELFEDEEENEEETTPPAPPVNQPPEEQTNPQSETSGITAAELATHNTQKDCWVGYKGSVYDVTAFLPRHPGGVQAIAKHCGTTDGFTTAFNKKHGTKMDARLAKEAPLKGALA